jgi:hypothetical protein
VEKKKIKEVCSAGKCRFVNNQPRARLTSGKAREQKRENQLTASNSAREEPCEWGPERNRERERERVRGSFVLYRL